MSTFVFCTLGICYFESRTFTCNRVFVHCGISTFTSVTVCVPPQFSGQKAELSGCLFPAEGRLLGHRWLLKEGGSGCSSGG